jgi:hypothetical protein
MPIIFIRDQPIFSSERMLHVEYDHKDATENVLIVRLKGLDFKTN